MSETIFEMMKERCSKDTHMHLETNEHYCDAFISNLSKCIIKKYLEEGIGSIDPREIELLNALGSSKFQFIVHTR